MDGCASFHGYERRPSWSPANRRSPARTVICRITPSTGVATTVPRASPRSRPGGLCGRLHGPGVGTDAPRPGSIRTRSELGLIHASVEAHPTGRDVAYPEAFEAANEVVRSGDFGALGV